MTANSAIAPLVEVTVSAPAHHRTRLIKGLLDSGADWTTLRMEWKESLRIRDSECFWTDLTGICGPDNPIKCQATLLEAVLDGHTFRLPVAFAKEVPVDLFGRFGLLERFTALLEGSQGLTTLDWVEAAGAPLTDQFQQRLKDELQKAVAQQD